MDGRGERGTPRPGDTMMKTIFLTAIAALLLAGPLPSQTKPDTAAPAIEKPVDENANGIDDRLEGRGKKKGKIGARGRDMFIDTDGDGICDGRETGVGFHGGLNPEPGKRGPKRGGRK
jgi:hypothetical protein